MNFSRASAPGRAAIRLLELGLLLATPLVIYRGFSEQFTTIKLVFTEGIVTAAAAVLAVCVIWGIARWPTNLRLSAPLGLLAASVLISCLASPLPAFSLVEAQYFLCGPVWLLFLVAWGGGECRVRWLATLVTLAGAVMAAIALLQWAGHDPLVFGGYHVEWGRMRDAMRLYSTLGNPNFVAGYLIGAIFLALALAAASGTLAGKVAGAASAVIIFAAIIGTRSGGAWLALAAGFLVARFVGREKAKTPNLPELRPAGAKLGLGFSPAVFLALLAGVQALVARFEGRAFLWRAGWPMFAEHPLVGGGWAMFQLRFPELQAQHVAAHPELIGYWTHTSQLHNDPLQILYEAGALGLVALGWLLWRYAREVREVTLASDGSSRLWLGASAGGATAILVNSLFNFQLAIPPTLILLFTLLALPGLLRPSPAGTDSQVANEKPSKRSFFLKLLATLLVVLAAALLGRGIWTRAAGDHALALGMEQERKGDFVRAEGHFRSGLERFAGDGRLHYGLARSLFVQARHAEALAEVLRAERSVADAHLEVLRARILDQMGQSSYALAAYRHALWLNPRLKSVPADIQRLSEGGPEAVQ
jgi:hypothetical protein